jgi:hypothetical protein
MGVGALPDNRHTVRNFAGSAHQPLFVCSVNLLAGAAPSRTRYLIGWLIWLARSILNDGGNGLIAAGSRSL